MYFTKVLELMTQVNKQMLEELRLNMKEQSKGILELPTKINSIPKKDTQLQATVEIKLRTVIFIVRIPTSSVMLPLLPLKLAETAGIST